MVDGGATRSTSVSNALAAVGTELVAIHDAARPLLTSELLEGVIRELLDDPEASAAVAATPVADTVKRVSTDVPRIVVSTIDRSGLWAAQTPQVFWTSRLREALGSDAPAAVPVTDEAMLVERAGGRVVIHPASPENLKVTNTQDLRMAELLLAQRAAS